MNEEHTSDWVAASRMLREAMELYRDQRQKSSLAKVVDDVIAYIDAQSGKWLDEKTIRRDTGNKAGRKKLHHIPDWRVKIYAKWLSEEVRKDHDWITQWLNTTA